MQVNNKTLIPQPNGDIRFQEGSFLIKKEIAVDCCCFDDFCLAAYAQRAGVVFVKSKPAELRLISDVTFDEEQYTLQVSAEGIEIRAAAERGIIHALTTLSLLEDGGAIPYCSISDVPKYSYRGLMLDCARHFFSVDEVERILEQMALLKLNVLHWNLSNDQGWRIESKAFPLLHLQSGEDYYTKDQIRAVVRFARERGIEVIPEIDMPGHTTAILAAYPDLSCKQHEVTIGNSAGIYRIILCPGKESTFDFLFQLIEEVAELFDSEFFHIGGDEAPKGEWAVCEDCKRRMEEEGLKDVDELQGYFTRRIADRLAKLGKRSICWNDVLVSNDLPPHLTIQYWVEMHAGTSVKKALSQGLPVIFSDMFHLYFDYPHSFTPLKKVYAFSPRVPKKYATQIKGIEACLWTERIITNEQLERQIFPRLFALSEIAWSYHKDYKGFLKRLSLRLSSWEQKGMSHVSCAFTPLESADPKGDERKQQNEAVFKALFAFQSDSGSEDQENPIAGVAIILKMLFHFLKLRDIPAIVKMFNVSKKADHSKSE